MIGQTLDGRYAIRSRIARGGMAMVYLANDLRLERRVAVKVMHEHLAEDDNFTRRFEQEARSAARLSHPNLVNVFDQGHDLGRTYLVMEYLPSITLRELLKQQKSLTAEQSMEIGEAVLAGLAAAHRAGIVHRDLKPENVMLADDGRIKLGDFGLARAVSANTTTGQALLGTIAYLSPELVTRGVADARSDVYAFGIMLYEMLTGEQPFTGEQPMQIAYQHAHSEVPAPSLRSTEASPELDQLVLWTTQREPEQRPLDAGEALDFLSAVRRGEPGENATRVLPSDLGGTPTPSTTVLDRVQQEALAAGSAFTDGGSFAGTAEQTPAADPPVPAGPIELAAASAAKRRRRGVWAALIVAVLVVVAGGIGWWFGQGPGSKVAVPGVAGQDLAAAESLINEQQLVPEVFECSSLEIPAGKAVRTEPGEGTRLDRGATVRVCKSTGPRQLAVPTIVGLAQPKAQELIGSQGFTFGKVIEERFSDQQKGTVLAALDADGNGLGETYSEKGRIDLIVSAGGFPDVTGSSPEQAASKLREAGLEHAPEHNTEAYSDTVKKGSVIGIVPLSETVRVGDTVGLQISLGPELFDIPDVAGKPLQEAMNILSGAGFKPSTLVPDALRDFAKATGTDPGAGKRAPKGAEIRVKSTISL
ncbi:Stk1 family PASTA domain-containing Ser/Thr kinase [Leucobacter sp. CSA2]|uniref:non-specific serine/threonine protein kinase n=1 Tax=Leucobacter edaphi TaxID=2796472 RepID=A0A934UXE7_9MICO|nr:Stk1 family PASTA domain-containing Ser/Thr kinase [Leucobacter edaphi]MBK0421521.1 Stk1 family PASTA domain-containing Ser/Thr kinase [Leucobacter edaphi]